jgi:K+-transporting ATPase ATPase C chain
MLNQFRAALAMFLLLTLLTGVAYPLLVTGIAQVTFPHAANGSMIMREGEVAGSKLIGRPFGQPGYFWGRPSATGPDAYHGAASTGSNLGPTNPALLEAIQTRIDAIRLGHPEQEGDVPIDLVTASASGLDPHISVAAARYQAQRVAADRGLPAEDILDLIDRHTQSRTFGVLGEPRVNVLQLNMSLDERTAQAE